MSEEYRYVIGKSDDPPVQVVAGDARRYPGDISEDAARVIWGDAIVDLINEDQKAEDGQRPATVADLIAAECDAVKAMLLAKNAAYGNSALDPLRVFSKAPPDEQIRVRLDDKLSRLARGSAAGEDVEADIIGYLVLLRVHRRMATALGTPLCGGVQASAEPLPNSIEEWREENEQ